MSKNNKPVRPMSMFDELFQINPDRSFLDAIDDFFTESFGMSGVKVEDTKTRYTIRVELPGVSKEDIDLELYDHYLRITVDRNEELTESTTGYARRTRSHFERSVPLPDNVLVRDMKASHKDGILVVTFPKRRGKKIEIE